MSVCLLHFFVCLYVFFPPLKKAISGLPQYYYQLCIALSDAAA